MNAVDKVKALCKERGIPIAKLERDCGFSNGYIGQLRKGTFPNDRLKIIADYLGISLSYLGGYDSIDSSSWLSTIQQLADQNPAMQHLIEDVSKLDPDNQKIVWDTVHRLLLYQDAIKKDLSKGGDSA